MFPPALPLVLSGTIELPAFVPTTMFCGLDGSGPMPIWVTWSPTTSACPLARNTLIEPSLCFIVVTPIDWFSVRIAWSRWSSRSLGEPPTEVASAI